MGVYNDYKNTTRREWEYLCSGAELLEAARCKHAEFAAGKSGARENGRIYG